ncbi:Hint domain-containing protein [Roseomonas sp. CECT 9278]|uniref:Hint domain-containing protein n=1 Tax=Roseomonas sp. CECT 9278 TaxID=2845823 RepID=UPI001E3E5FC9|nr:Hint domain-containing protein [Roseomonas sp. CECT 9278]CAH0262613.1 hypothetical protein ROS9278_03440 [Roseomonas sp. CECT 9278]
MSGWFPGPGATTGSDSFTGTAGDDAADGLGGDDTLRGALGADSLSGGDDNDLLIAFDTVLGGGAAPAAAADTLDGGSGNDSLFSTDQVFGAITGDTLIGGAGIDTAFISIAASGASADFVPDAAGDWANAGFLVTGVEQLHFTATGAANRIEGRVDGGGDTLVGLEGDDTLRGFAGADSLLGGADRDLLEGGADRDTLAGDASDDTLVGEAGNDVLRGGSGTDSLAGGADNDLLVDLTGNDALDGGDGNDSILGGADNDTLLGGAGNDSLNGEAGTDSILAGEGNDTALGGDAADTILGEDGADSILGGAGNDSIEGGAGNDTIFDGDNTLSGADTLIGGEGDDSILSRAGGDSIDGGEGQDTLVFRHTQQFFGDPPTDPPLDFRPVDSATPTSLGEGSTVVGVEVFVIRGSLRSDTIQGLGGNDNFVGNGGGDSLWGGDGNDTLAGAGAIATPDTLMAGAGNDSISATGGADSIDGGIGQDTLSADARSGETWDFRPVDSATAASLGAGGGSVVGIEVFRFSGSDGNDTFFGLDGNDSLDGSTGADLIGGGDGNDTLEGGNDSPGGAADTMLGGKGDDRLISGSGFRNLDAVYVDGGEGFDTLVLSGAGTLSNAPINFTPVSSTIEASTGIGGTVINVERFDISGSEVADTIGGLDADDSLLGGRGSDLLRGEGGNDTLRDQGLNPGSVASNDTLEGGAGDDVLESTDFRISGTGTAEPGSDRIDGGEGDDLAIIGRFQITEPGKALNFTPEDTLETALGDGGVVLGVERFNIRGTQVGDTIAGLAEGDYDDTLRGEGGADSLLGFGGDDSIRDGDLSSNTDADTIFGGLGSDTVVSGGGVDLLVGGDSIPPAPPEGEDTPAPDGDDGIDLAVISRFNLATSFSFLPTDPLAAETISDGTTVFGFEYFNINGGSGDDTIGGLGLNDTLLGGGGNDSLLGRDGDDLLRDVNGGLDTLQGEGGNDTLEGNTGADSLVGGEGQDFADYNTSAAGVTVSLAPGVVGSGGDAAGDTLVDIEALNGSDHNDVLSGLAGASDTLQGGGGDDTILATGGGDVLDGGTRTLFGIGVVIGTVPGHDMLDAGADTAGVVIDLAAQTVAGGLLEGSTISRFEDAAGGSGDDSLTGDGGANTLLGRDGTDTITGGAGDDSIDAGGDGDLAYWRAGDGNDTIQFGAGDDTLYLTGWTGDDTDDWTETTEADGARLFVLGTGGSVRAYGLEDVTCFLAGTMIATPTGEVPVESLRAGDMVLTGSRGEVPQGVIWMGRTRVAVAGRADPTGVAPVLIRAGALGDGLPRRDLRVSPEHGMLLDGHLVPAVLLVNGTSIVQECWRAEAQYWHVELPAHGLVLAEGAPSETYYDDGNRGLFDNHVVTTLFKDFAPFAPRPRYEAAACRPVLRGGPALAALRARLAERAAMLRARVAG